MKFGKLFFMAGTAALGVMGCGKSTEPRPDATIQGKVTRAEDGLGLAGANVVLIDANANSPVARILTTVQGNFSFKAPPGSYALTAAAQGRIPSPPVQGGKPLPFQADAGGTYTRNLALDADSGSGGTGSISGTVRVSGSGSRNGILIVASITTGSYSTVTGPDGYFVFFNLPPGSYAVEGFKARLVQDSVWAGVDVVPGATTGGVNLSFSAAAGHALTGKITFLASPNSVVDITLVNTFTRDAVPGLSTFNDGSNSFTLNGIPPGDYLAWASYRNDGYVMDPDRIQKFGLPLVSFLPTDTAQTLDLDVTGAVSLISPTNPSDSLFPVTVNGLTPTFSWAKYPSAKEYIVEVFDANGRRIWGGYDGLGLIRHTQVTAESVAYNFDGTAAQPLKNGSTYSWKVYADDGATPNIQTLISSSEDLRGLFRVGP